MSLLTGAEIQRQVQAGRITLDPFNPAQLNPNSYNLMLRPLLRTYEGTMHLDMKRPTPLVDLPIPDDGLILFPGQLYLGMTVEKAGSSHYAPMLSGRSSAARLGIMPHLVAGFGDAGFADSWTLEIVVVRPVKIYPLVSIVQVFFEQLEGEISLYRGKYRNGAQDGPTASKFWEELTER